MSVEHEPANPRLDSLLRQIVAAGDLQPEQNQRVRARLGLAPDQPTAQPTLTLPASQPAPIRTQEQEGPPMIATSQRLRRQWLQFALAAVAFIAAGVVLAMIFDSRADDPDARPGVAASPEATATIAPATATIASQDSSALPTPDRNGTYRDITVEQARQIVPFEIVVPEQVPEGFEPPVLSVVERRIPSAPGARIYEVEMVYALSGDESPAQSVKFTQLGPNGGDVQITNTESTMGITANGVEATRIEGRSTGGDPILAYTWEHDGLHYLILSSPAGDLTPELVDALMQDIFSVYTPTVESESARLEQERAELMTVPVPDSCAVSPWAGPDFRIRRSASAAYFVEGEGLTLGTTHGVLFAGDNQITWLADAPLTNEEALSGPRTMTIFRSDVAGDPIPVEVPIEDAQQLDRGILPDDVERGWSTTVNLPEEGCWEIIVELGAHVLEATVYVYAR
jgi:hypothetical protein